MDLKDDRGNFSHEWRREITLEDQTRAKNVVLVLKSKRKVTTRFAWTWLQKTLAEHFSRVRLEALREAAGFQCQDCRECIPLEKSGSGWVHSHPGWRQGWINRRLVACRASQLRSSTLLGGFVS